MIEKLIDYTTRMNGQRLPLKAFIRLSANACKKLETVYRQRCESCCIRAGFMTHMCWS